MGEAKYITVLVDDSAISRGIFQKALIENGKFEIAAMLSNGRKAVDYCRTHNVDLVITDYEMPEMNGIDATKIISSDFGIPVCMYSDDNSIRNQAQDAGAFLFHVKPNFSSYSEQLMAAFIEKLLNSLSQMPPVRRRIFENDSIGKERKCGFDILCIGASTGGPTAVEAVLKGLGSNFPLPILYVQHIDSGADLKMASWFNKVCPNTPLVLAKDGQIAERGKVYMAPADKHLVIDHLNKDGRPVLQLSDEPPERFLKPAVNKLFRSAAYHFKKNCLAVLLTGMGRDGAEGCKEILNNGGYTIVEDKSTCTVFGMPAAAIEMHAATKVYPRDLIAGQILALIQ